MFLLEIHCQEYPIIDNCRLMTVDEAYKYISYDATLTLSENGVVFFREDVSVAEFFWYINEWHKKITSGKSEAFSYTTVEHSGSILTFAKVGADLWEIDSVWRKLESPLLIKQSELLAQVSIMIDELAAAFERKPD